MNLKPRELFEIGLSDLPGYYSDREKRNLVLDLMKYFLVLDQNDLVINEKSIVRGTQAHNSYLKGLDRLKDGEPVQYILGIADFLSIPLRVNSSVLIPRPETEELALLAEKKILNSKATAIDLGTGSGCLAIYLKRKLSKLRMIAMDVSEEALEVAAQNAVENGVEIEFHHSDFLEEGFPIDHLDLIVSNPPYVPVAEKTTLRENVLNYEPHRALFPASGDPLIFYREIEKRGRETLRSQGQVFLEIHEDHGSRVLDLFSGGGWSDMGLKKDVFGKDRIFFASRD